MLRKIVWGVIILFIGCIWFSEVMKSCGSKATAERMSDLDPEIGVDEEVVFMADEDSGDDGYIISDENDKEDRLASVGEEKNMKEAPTEYDSEEEDEEDSEVDLEEEEEEDDFSEKSPIAKITAPAKKVSRKAIAETTYSNSESVGYFVITGSFSDEENADRMVEEMKEMGYENAEKIVFDFSQYFSVVSGKYDTESSARAKSLELKNRNINAYVHKMRSKLFGD